jgi:hypothetical protein
MGTPRAELLDEPRLPDARFTGHKDELGPPTLGRTPESHQTCPLGRAPDERRTADPSGLTLRGFALRRQQCFVGLARRRRRLDAQLALQGHRALVIHPKRPRPVPARVMQPHEEPVRLLAERVVSQESLGVQDRLGVFAARLENRGQTLKGLQIALAEPLALVKEPLIVAAFEKVSRVELDGFPQRGEAAVGVFPLCPRERLLESGDVEPEGCVGPPPERPRRHVEEPVRVRKGAPEVVEHVAEVRSRLWLGRVGPEEERETLPGLRSLPVEEEVSE